MGGSHSVSVAEASPHAEARSGSPSAAHHGVPMDAQLMEVLLQTLTRAPAAWRAAEFLGCDQSSAALLGVLQPDEAAMRAEQPRPFALSDELEAELQDALHVAASRGAAAKLASMLVCTGSLGRAVADTFAPVEERAARVAQARAVHDMVYALRESGDLSQETKETVVEGLAAWCRAENASTALDGFYDDAESAAGKWRAYAAEFTREATMPRRIRHVRRGQLARRLAVTLLASLAGGAQPPGGAVDPEAEERAAWCATLCHLVQGAPA